MMDSNDNSSSKYLIKEAFWFKQTLDHYSPYDHRRFGQRCYEFLDHFRAPGGPIFLKICGESECRGISNDYLAVLARKFGAAIVSLEHRYYGKSFPFDSLSTENLRYFSSKQALSDLAAFRQYYQCLHTSSPVIIVDMELISGAVHSLLYPLKGMLVIVPTRMRFTCCGLKTYISLEPYKVMLAH